MNKRIGPLRIYQWLLVIGVFFVLYKLKERGNTPTPQQQAPLIVPPPFATRTVHVSQPGMPSSPSTAPGHWSSNPIRGT